MQIMGLWLLVASQLKSFFCNFHHLKIYFVPYSKQGNLTARPDSRHGKFMTISDLLKTPPDQTVVTIHLIPFLTQLSYLT